MRRLQIITGHYGTGKTEYAVNLALSLAGADKKLALADLDIVNPYFRAYEQAERLREAGIRVIVSSCGGAVDMPAIDPAVLSLFQDKSWSGVIDIGGDPIGAHVLARFVDELHAEDFDLLFVVNANRPETHDLEKALASLRGVEAACGQKMTGLVICAHRPPPEKFSRVRRSRTRFPRRPACPLCTMRCSGALCRRFVNSWQSPFCLWTYT